MRPDNHQDHHRDSQQADDELWKLLGHARRRQPSPFFSGNVLREVRRLQEKRRSAWSPRRWIPATLAATCALAALATLGTWPDSTPPQQQTVASLDSQLAVDYYLLENLDELIAYEESSLWVEDSFQ